MKFISLIHCTRPVPGATLEGRELFGSCRRSGAARGEGRVGGGAGEEVEGAVGAREA